MNYRIFVAGILLGCMVLAAACGNSGTSGPEEGRLEFQIPEELPEEVAEWVDDFRDREDAQEDWMRFNDEIYVAVARGESPNPGHGVTIDNVEYCYDDETGVEITVSATYTAPEEGKSYAQVIVYPVAVAAIDLEQLPDVDMADIAFAFDIDDSQVETSTQKTTVTLFFATRDGYMTRVYRPLDEVEIDANLIAGEIMVGPEDENLLPILPEGTTLTVKPDPDDSTTAIADFSEEIEDVEGSLGEMLAVYGVVNALLENDLGFERVRLTVEGKEVDSLGHLDLTEPLTGDNSLIKGGK